MSCVFLVLSCNLCLCSSPSNETWDLLGNATFIWPILYAECRPVKLKFKRIKLNYQRNYQSGNSETGSE